MKFRNSELNVGSLLQEMDNNTLAALRDYNLTSYVRRKFLDNFDEKQENIYQFNGKFFENFADVYDHVHKPVSLTICAFGIFANVINLIVLTRRYMACVSNIILTGLSCAQLLLLLNYMTLILYNYAIETCTFPSMLISYPWTMFKWINVNLNVSFHSTALFHTLFLTACRFMAVKWPHKAKRLLTYGNAKRSSLVIHLLTPLLCCPTFLTTSIRRVVLSKKQRLCGLRQFYYALEYSASPAFFQCTFWLYGVAFKLGPSVAMLALSYYLIRSLKSYHDRSAALLTVNGRRGTTTTRRDAVRTRSTKMFVIVALLCAAVEFPHGVVNMLNGLFGPRFGREVYDNLGDFFEMLTLFYSSLNFVLYCAMSRGYQRTVKRLAAHICRCCHGNGNNVSNTESPNFDEILQLGRTCTLNGHHCNLSDTNENNSDAAKLLNNNCTQSISCDSRVPNAMTDIL